MTLACGCLGPCRAPCRCNNATSIMQIKGRAAPLDASSPSSWPHFKMKCAGPSPNLRGNDAMAGLQAARGAAPGPHPACQEGQAGQRAQRGGVQCILLHACLQRHPGGPPVQCLRCPSLCYAALRCIAQQALRCAMLRCAALRSRHTPQQQAPAVCYAALCCARSGCTGDPLRQRAPALLPRPRLLP
jgi:hypothetical protein